jgi:hypothetical protein
MSIHVYVLLCIENEEEVVVEEEVARKLKFHLSRTTSTLISVGQTLSLLQHKASPDAFTPFLVTLNSLSIEKMH